LFGFSINTLSLFGLVLAVGLVVDDAIVVVEAVERHIEEGMAPREATLQAMREVSGPVIGIALVLSAVFIPTAFLPGITGRLYQQFALTSVRERDTWLCELVAPGHSKGRPQFCVALCARGRRGFFRVQITEWLFAGRRSGLRFSGVAIARCGFA
jgi:hypothetical protein